jgi:hypothetical protein
MIPAEVGSRFLTYAGFALIAAVAVGWEILAVIRLPSMSLERVIRWAMRGRTVRLLLLAFWIWAGWHLFARGSGAFKPSP